MFAVIFIPNFSLQAVLRHEPESRARAIALVDPELPKPAIVQLTATARAWGVGEGLTASQAMARCAELVIKSRSPAQEASATEVLLQTAYAFSPNIESTAPGVCTMELRGLGFRPDDNAAEQWAGKMTEVLAQYYIEAKVGVAATPELALLAARAAESILTLERRSPTRHDSVIQNTNAPGQETGAPATGPFESFPISSLEPPLEILEILRRWGIQTIGELLALGKDNVAERLGPAAVELFNRVSPDSPRPLKLVAPAEEFAEQMEFENEIETVEPLLFALRRFVEQLSRRLELIYLVVAEFHLQLGLSSGAKYERVFKIPSPTGNIDILFRMLQTHLETVRTDSAILSLRLVAKPGKPEAQQFGLFESSLRDPNQFAETLARLTALCGHDRVGTPRIEAAHRPDTFTVAQAFQPPCKKPGGSEQPIENGERARLGRSEPRPRGSLKRSNQVDASMTSYASVFGAEARRTAAEAAALPILTNLFQPPDPFCKADGKPALQLRRFRPPLPSHIEFRDTKPALLRSHVFIGPIVETRGPFLSSGNWWDSGRWAREEWDVETADGSLLRIFRSNEGCFVEGVYD